MIDLIEAKLAVGVPCAGINAQAPFNSALADTMHSWKRAMACQTETASMNTGVPHTKCHSKGCGHEH